MTPVEHLLINDHQRDFPLCHAPYARIAQRMGLNEVRVLDVSRDLIARGIVSRIGAVFAPHAIGSSTLAALQVPPGRLPEVTAMVSAMPEVNHNYLREHAINLWFVVAARNGEHLNDVLGGIESNARCGPLLRCPLEEEYRIDLGFDLNGGHSTHQATTFIAHTLALSDTERTIVRLVQEGLPLVPHPYEQLAMRAGCGEEELLARLRGWTEAGVIRRWGFVVRHLELGYRANAMVVWRVPEERVRSIGTKLAAQSGVTLCYRRRACAPHWPYNLYCMVHGQDRALTQARIESLTQDAGLVDCPRAVLFSVARYKQCGARYVHAQEAVDASCV